MNKRPRIVAAAINTALFHIGNKPSRTPEKTKPGRVAPNLSDKAAGCCCASVSAGNDATFVIDVEIRSFPLAFSETVVGAVSGNAVTSGGNVSLEECAWICFGRTVR